MQRTSHVTQEDKDNLIRRALKSRPTYVEAHATPHGWAVDHKNGTHELLVSFPNLSKLLEDTQTAPEPVQDAVVADEVETPVEVIAPAVEPVVEVVEEDNIEDDVVDAPKKRGRPAKVA